MRASARLVKASDKGEDMTVSVAMASYNGEKYIEEQLTSIFNQDLQPDEVILCDDGSTDATVQIVSEFIEKNGLTGKWRLFQNEARLGFIHNFFHAIAKTKGDLVFLSDQDDVFHKSKFRSMKAVFERHSDCLVLNSGYRMIDENSHPLKGPRYAPPVRKKEGKLSFETFLYRMDYPGFAMAFRGTVRELLNGMDLDGVYGHDLLIHLIGLSHHGEYEIRERLSEYRIHEANASGIGSIKSAYGIERRIAQKRNELSEYERLKQVIQRNHFDALDAALIERRRRVLHKRIRLMEKKKLWGLAALLAFCRQYPKKTILGDMACVMKAKKQR